MLNFLYKLFFKKKDCFHYYVNENGTEFWQKNTLLHRDNDLPAIIDKLGHFWFKEGKKHRDNDLPAVEWFDSGKEWYQNGLIHRENGPAVIDKDGSSHWFNQGVKHRNLEPAYIGKEGKKWYKDGFLHRVNGPAIEWINGDKEWYQNGLLHRVNGPAIEYQQSYYNKENTFWLNGEETTQEKIYKDVLNIIPQSRKNKKIKL